MVIILKSLSLSQNMTTFCFLARQTKLVSEQEVSSKHSLICLGYASKKKDIVKL